MHQISLLQVCETGRMPSLARHWLGPNVTSAELSASRWGGSWPHQSRQYRCATQDGAFSNACKLLRFNPRHWWAEAPCLGYHIGIAPCRNVAPCEGYSHHTWLGIHGPRVGRGVHPSLGQRGQLYVRSAALAFHVDLLFIYCLLYFVHESISKIRNRKIKTPKP